MNARCVVALMIFSAGMLAQSAAPACPADRPVDDIIAEIHKDQSKKKHHISNPAPDNICIFAWCHGRSSKEAPPTSPGSAMPAKNSSGNQSTSSSKTTVDPCDEAMEKALKATHDVEVGDEYFTEKSYDAAGLRYQEAVEEKPGDIAIHVRLGRVLEKLGKTPQAIDEYKAALQMAESGKWFDEATAALHRLQPR